MFFHRLLLSILLLSVSGNPCSSPELTQVTQHLIDSLKKEAATTCNCNANVTDCLCLPVSSGNCSTSCFQDGLKMMSHTLKPHLNRSIFRVQAYIRNLRILECNPFSCSQPCNETFTVNTMEFLKALQENFQKVPVSNN